MGPALSSCSGLWGGRCSCAGVPAVVGLCGDGCTVPARPGVGSGAAAPARLVPGPAGVGRRCAAGGLRPVGCGVGCGPPVGGWATAHRSGVGWGPSVGGQVRPVGRASAACPGRVCGAGLGLGSLRGRPSRGVWFPRRLTGVACRPPPRAAGAATAPTTPRPVHAQAHGRAPGHGTVRDPALGLGDDDRPTERGWRDRTFAPPGGVCGSGGSSGARGRGDRSLYTGGSVRGPCI